MNARQFAHHACGFGFTEAPRWHNNTFYFSDFSGQRVRRINPDGSAQEIARVPHQPSGLGWLPDGRLLIVSMADHKLLLQQGDGTLHEYADLIAIATGDCNDRVVDRQGRARHQNHFVFKSLNHSALS